MELRPGQQLGGYEIVSHVKSGGMASLYLARRRGAAGFSRPVAVKVVHPELARDPKFVRMFLDEARLAVLIQHPNVVRVEELIEAEGTYLMVMEYVHGTSLFEVLRRLAKQGRRLSPELAVWIGVQVADGLHAAHELRGPDGALLDVVHRDISPQNILLSFGGHVKVIDFGIAKSRQRMDLTSTGVIRGKLGYMSPEQANATKVDRRTDVYALGIVMWEMLTSRRLFRGKTEVELLDKVRNPRVPRPSLYGQVHPGLENVVMEALAPPVEMRIPSAHDLRTRLLQVMPEAGAIHSSMLAGLLSTVMADEMADAPLTWTEAGLTGEPMRPSTSFLEDHTVHAAAPDFSSEQDLDAEEEASPTLASHPGPLGQPALAGSGMPAGMPTIPSHRPRGGPPPPPSSVHAPPPPPPAPGPFAGGQPSPPVPRQVVGRPAEPSAPRARFTLPPDLASEASELATGTYDPNDPRVPRHRPPSPAEPRPSSLGSFFVTFVSLAVLFTAVGVAAVLAYRAGLLNEVLPPSLLPPSSEGAPEGSPEGDDGPQGQAPANEVPADDVAAP